MEHDELEEEEGPPATEVDASRFQDSEEGEEVVTAQAALHAVENAWLNEKFAPEILPHKSDLVDCMLQQIAHIDENTKKLARDDTRLAIHKMELDRVRFVISSYLRTRLEKIEKYAIAILAEEAKRAPDKCYLTSGELKFAEEYLASVETLFRTIALRQMPNNFQEFQHKNLEVKPNMHAHVFLRANRDISGIIIPGTLDQEIHFEAGSQHIIQYKAVADLVKNESVQLI